MTVSFDKIKSNTVPIPFMAVRKVCVSCSQLNGLAGRMVGRGISPMKPPPMFRFPIPDVAEATPPAGAFKINNTNLKIQIIYIPYICYKKGEEKCTGRHL